MAHVQQEITVLSAIPTHEPYLAYFPAARRHCPLAGTHCAYPRRDGQVELAWVVGYTSRLMR